MPVAEAKPVGSSSSDGDKHRHINRDVRDMVSAITSRLAGIHKAGSSSSSHGQEVGDDEDDNGIGIVTLAGTNIGANLRGELDEKSQPEHPRAGDDSDALRTYVNSNFQAVNNSIMMGGSYKANDPGVHLEISDFVERNEFKSGRRVKKGKGKERGSKSDKSSSSSTSDSDKSSE